MGKLDNLFGSDNIMEKVSGLDFIISPRAYFCINTTGAEVLVRTVTEMAGLHRNMTLLDICCGSGTIGLSLASRVGNVRSDFRSQCLKYLIVYLSPGSRCGHGG